jgi:hypothetical protein
MKKSRLLSPSLLATSFSSSLLAHSPASSPPPKMQAVFDELDAHGGTPIKIPRPLKHMQPSPADAVVKLMKKQDLSPGRTRISTL